MTTPFRLGLVLACLAASPALVCAQTQDIQGSIIPARTIPTDAELYTLRQALHSPVNLKGFPASLPLSEALERLSDQLEAKKEAVLVYLDTGAFVDEFGELDLGAILVEFPVNGPPLTARSFLNHLLRQIPTTNATLSLLPGRVVITTRTEDEHRILEERSRDAAKTHKARAVLHRAVNPQAFRRSMSVKDALSTLYEQVAAHPRRGAELPILVNKEALQGGDDKLEIYERRITMPALSRPVRAGELLGLIVRLLPGRATFTVRNNMGSGGVEITTVRQLQRGSDLWR